jgi:dTDP-4-amino-4,6-dideoxygalactose transaminase
MASAEAIALVGATPIFVDIDADTFNIDPDALQRAIGALATGDRNLHPLPNLPEEALRALRPRGVIAVDLFGLPADYARINAIAAEHGLFVIEDAAQSFGGSLGNRRAGALSEIACTSFFPAKPLGCYGDGGALFTDDDALAELFRSIRVHGQGSDRYENVRLGITGRLDSIQAAILLVKLDIFENELTERQRVADEYDRLIQASGVDLITPRIPEGYTTAWAQYSVLAQDGAARAAMQARLADAGVPTAVYYPKPLHLQGAFADLGYKPGDFAVSEATGARIFSLPMHPYLPTEQIGAIVAAMKEVGE